MRRTTACGTVGGRPNLTPLAFFAASASLVRWPISRRSNWPNVARTCAIASPAGVDVSTAQSSATRVGSPEKPVGGVKSGRLLRIPRVLGSRVRRILGGSDDRVEECEQLLLPPLRIRRIGG